MRTYRYLIHHRGHISTNTIVIQKALDASNSGNSNLHQMFVNQWQAK